MPYHNKESILFRKIYIMIAVLGVCLGKTAIAEVDSQSDVVTSNAPQIVSSVLPIRTTSIPTTTNTVPHVQLNSASCSIIVEEMLRQVSHIPEVYIRDTIISLPGAKGFWLNDEAPLANPQVIVGGREFAHVHPDGSLHLSLSPELALAAVEAGWATYHPWAAHRKGWEGFVMLYSPVNAEELDVVLQLILSSYNFITGKTLDSLSIFNISLNHNQLEEPPCLVKK